MKRVTSCPEFTVLGSYQPTDAYKLDIGKITEAEKKYLQNLWPRQFTFPPKSAVFQKTGPGHLWVSLLSYLLPVWEFFTEWDDVGGSKEWWRERIEIPLENVMQDSPLIPNRHPMIPPSAEEDKLQQGYWASEKILKDFVAKNQVIKTLASYPLTTQNTFLFASLVYAAQVMMEQRNLQSFKLFIDCLWKQI